MPRYHLHIILVCPFYNEIPCKVLSRSSDIVNFYLFFFHREIRNSQINNIRRLRNEILSLQIMFTLRRRSVLLWTIFWNNYEIIYNFGQFFTLFDQFWQIEFYVNMFASSTWNILFQDFLSFWKMIVSMQCKDKANRKCFRILNDIEPEICPFFLFYYCYSDFADIQSLEK